MRYAIRWFKCKLKPPKNKQFAQLLNRVREAKITEHDETTLKARVTTLDDPDHFTDALHVYGTNQQADQYNAAMLQKLDTLKYVIQSSDIMRDRDTRQVKISLDGKNAWIQEDYQAT